MSAVAHAFDDVPHTPRGHLGLLFYEAAFGVVRHVRQRARGAAMRTDVPLDDFPFLGAYLSELQARLPGIESVADGTRRLRDAIGAWERASDVWLPLRALCEDGGLTRDARASLVALGLVEEEAGFAALFAALQAPLGHRRPTAALLREIVQRGGDDAPADAWTVCSELVNAGLAEVVDASVPRSEAVLRVPPAVWSVVRGEGIAEQVPGARHRPMEQLDALNELVLADAARARLREIVPLASAGGIRHLVVRGMPGTDRISAIGAVARQLGRGLLVVEVAETSQSPPRVLGALCTLTRAVPLFVLELGPAETFTVPPLPGYRGFVGLVAGREGGIAGATGAAHLELDADGPPQRLAHWRRALGDHAGPELEALAERCALSGAHIKACAPLAIAAATLDGRAHVRRDDVAIAARAVGRQLLDALATRLETHGRWQQLILSPSTDEELNDLARRCRHREQLAGELAPGMPGGLNRGVRALLEGPSGTGKTLAARVLASELGMDLYRVDLSAVVSKYVGETEKNLSKVFARAEDLDIVLLLDEGDALLTRRTDVRSANDRYANLETNYLLQRLETYSGIVLVTTNLASQIDTAFRRRMDVVARFHLPDAERRQLLWLAHMPRDHAVDALALEDIATRYVLTGGEIRNAVVHATLLALSRGGVVEREDLLAAVLAEHRKAGASFSAAEPLADDGADAALAEFLEAIQ